MYRGSGTGVEVFGLRGTRNQATWVFRLAAGPVITTPASKIKIEVKPGSVLNKVLCNDVFCA
jgi:hypothetical protein